MSDVIYEKQGHIAFIRLNRPDSLNAINRSMTKELSKIWCDFRDDNSLWVAVLSGEGKTFCAGADVKELAVEKWEFRQSLIFGDDRCIPSNYGVWKPLIAAVHGHVYGAGLLLALECDIIVATNDAMFGIPEGKVGIVTLFAPFLSDYMPRKVAAELLFTGKPIDAQRAYQLGLVNKVTLFKDLLSVAIATANEICDNSPLATWATKQLFYRSRNMDYGSALALIEHIATPVSNTEDAIEAKRAFAEKRKMQWKLK